VVVRLNTACSVSAHTRAMELKGKPSKYKDKWIKGCVEERDAKNITNKMFLKKVNFNSLSANRNADTNDKYRYKHPCLTIFPKNKKMGRVLQLSIIGLLDSYLEAVSVSQVLSLSIDR
jgi:hypothetical protein